jgi:phosphatidylethanolamine/phosphatidyl-N-methylethanolamine N-methyltransferase
VPDAPEVLLPTHAAPSAALAISVDAAPVAPWRLFFRRFLRSPGTVASLAPSSRYLAAAMLRGLALPPSSAVLELGPGTGPFTDAIAARLGAQHGYLGVELDPEFVAMLRARHPTLEFAEADVFDLPRLLDARPHLAPAAVLSGLPLVWMPRDAVEHLLEVVRDRLLPGGAFRTFSYVHMLPSADSRWLRGCIRRVFPRYGVREVVWRNLPPALVLEGRK